MTNVARRFSANERLKSRFEGTIASSLVIAVLVHLLVLQLFPAWTVEDWTSAAADAVPIIQLDNIAIPVAPPRLQRPAAPVAAPNVSAEATLPVVSFPDAAELSPPPPPRASVERGASGGFEVFTVAPVLLDPERFQRELLREYPSELRDARIGGKVVLHISIDEEGRVLSASVGTSSGYERMDEAALELVDRMRFRPAMNRDRRVAVLVSIPIEFRVRR